MTVFILILFIIFLFSLGCGVALWFALYIRRLAQGEKITEELPFRWNYIMLPPAIFLLSIILAAYFYHQLPAEVAYHFKLDGTPDKWLNREMTVVWVLAPQLFLTLLAGAIVWGITKLGILSRRTAWVKPERLLSFMGNIIVLPQLTLCFAMLDIFSYNSYQIHIIPRWIFLLIILGLATIALGLFLALIMSRAKWQLISQPSRRTKEE